jgi:hypothetical protein
MLRQIDAAARRALFWLAGAGCPGAALADPADFVFVPYATAGARVVAYAAGVEHGPDGAREAQQTATLGWSPTARWFTSAYAGWIAADGGRFAFDEWSWLNHVQLNPPGAGPVDLGLLCEIERPRDRAEGTGIVCGPTLQADTDRLQLNLNALFSKHLHGADPEPWNLGYQWQAKALVGRGVELGAQGFGALGPWNRWAPAARQEHTLGPAVFAKWTLADGRALQLDAGLLFGLGSGSPRDLLRLRMQHEF